MTLPMPAPVREDAVVEEWALEKDDEASRYTPRWHLLRGRFVVREISAPNPDDPDSMRHFRAADRFGSSKRCEKQGEDGRHGELEGLD
jgi:hypothetical protein